MGGPVSKPLLVILVAALAAIPVGAIAPRAPDLGPGRTSRIAPSSGSGFSASTLDEMAVYAGALVDGEIVGVGGKVDYEIPYLPFALQYYQFRIERVVAQRWGPELRPGQTINVGMKAMSDNRTAGRMDEFRRDAAEVAEVSKSLNVGERYTALIAPDGFAPDDFRPDWGVVGSNWGLMARESEGLKTLAPSGPLRGTIVSDAQLASALAVLGTRPPVRKAADPYPAFVDGQAPVPGPGRDPRRPLPSAASPSTERTP